LSKYCNATEEEISNVLTIKGEKVGDFWTIPSCDKRIAKSQANRENGSKGGRPTKPKENPTNNPTETQTITQTEPNSKGKEKEKEKENVNNNINEKKEKAFNFRLSLIELGVNEKIVEDWIKVRKTKNATNTETAFNKIKSQILKSGKTANECITLAVEKDWKGFEAEWIKNNNTNYLQKEQPASHVHTTKKETIADFGWDEFLKK
jgi:hypothetical protein